MRTIKPDPKPNPFAIARQVLARKRAELESGGIMPSQLGSFTIKDADKSTAQAVAKLLTGAYMIQIMQLAAKDKDIVRYSNTAESLNKAIDPKNYNEEKREWTFILAEFGKVADIEKNLDYLENEFRQAHPARIRGVVDMPDADYNIIYLNSSVTGDVDKDRPLRIKFTEMLAEIYQSVGRAMAPQITEKIDITPTYPHKGRELSLILIPKAIHTEVIKGLGTGRTAS
jgi:hypothetical protein